MLDMSDDESFYSAHDSDISFESCDGSDSMPSLRDELINLFTPCKNLLNICHVNAQSIPSHYFYFEEVFSIDCVHAILVSESWLKPSLMSSLYPLNDFVLVRNDRIEKGGGGVAIYLRANIPYKIILASPSAYSASPEFLFLEIDIKGVKAILGVVYCPPTVNFFDALESALTSTSSEYMHCIIMGDFNTDLLRNSSRSQKFRSIIESVDLQILPLAATHHNIDTDDSWIDHIITASPDYVIKHGQLSAPAFSRHDLIYISYKLISPKLNPVVLYIRNFSRMDFDKLKSDAYRIDLTSLFKSTCIDDKVSILNNIVLGLYNKHAPKHQVRVKRSPAPWMTEAVRLAMTRRDRAFVKFKKHRTQDSWDRYRVLRNRCNQMVRNAKRRYIHSNIANSSTADVWKFLKTLGISKAVTSDRGPSITLDEINHHFISTSPLDPTVRSTTIASIQSMPSPPIPFFHFLPVTEDEIQKSVLAIKSKAVGCDEVSKVMVSMILECLLPAITHIINYSLDSGQYPTQWKKAFVRPLPKIPNPSLPTHFRPISILPYLSKVLEACVHKQISMFITKHNLLNKYQSGFRAGHSTTTALIKVTDDIRMGMDEQKLTVVVLVDFSNAFNTVDHDILIAFLTNLRFSIPALEWFSSYLRGRQQSVRLGQEFSRWADIETGVPQGGILSPLMFSLFINSITSVLNCSYHLYADDLQLYVQSSVNDLNDNIHKLNHNLDAIRDWSYRHGVLVNPTKCKAMVIGSSRMLAKINNDNLAPVFYNGTLLPFCKSVKNLGLHIDHTLSWEVQVAETSRKVTATLRSLCRLKNFLPFKTKLLLIQTLILPIIDYADVCYPDLSQYLLDKLERLLNNCIRFIFGLRKYDHISQYRSKLKWLSIRQRRSSRTLQVLHSILNDPNSPSYLKDNFQYLYSTNDRVPRSQNCLKIRIPPHRSGFYNSSFTVQSILLWNALPVDIKKTNNKNYFKRLVREFCRKNNTT